VPALLHVRMHVCRPGAAEATIHPGDSIAEPMTGRFPATAAGIAVCRPVDFG